MTFHPGVEARLKRVMSAVLGIPTDRIGPDGSQETLAEWDSVRHLELMLALEEEFRVQFEAEEMATLGSVALLEKRLGSGAGDG